MKCHGVYIMRVRSRFLYNLFILFLILWHQYSCSDYQHQKMCEEINKLHELAPIAVFQYYSKKKHETMLIIYVFKAAVSQSILVAIFDDALTSCFLTNYLASGRCSCQVVRIPWMEVHSPLYFSNYFYSQKIYQTELESLYKRLILFCVDKTGCEL